MAQNNLSNKSKSENYEDMLIYIAELYYLKGLSQQQIADILKMQRHIATQSSKATLKKHPDWVLSDELIQLGDVNRNGKIDVGDILKLQRYLAACADRNVAKKHPEWLEL